MTLQKRTTSTIIHLDIHFLHYSCSMVMTTDQFIIRWRTPRDFHHMKTYVWTTEEKDPNSHDIVQIRFVLHNTCGLTLLPNELLFVFRRAAEQVITLSRFSNFKNRIKKYVLRTICGNLIIAHKVVES
ncbi:hypothetical protein ACJX0J_009274 [Zea mays]